MQRGFCNHKDKNCRIVTEWKCVDIRYPDKITPEDKALRDKECRSKDWYGVCSLCRHFVPDAAAPVQPDVKPVYAPDKPAAQATQPDDPEWDSMMDEII